MTASNLSNFSMSKLKLKIKSDSAAEVEAHAKEKLRKVIELAKTVAVPNEEISKFMSVSWNHLLESMRLDLLPNENISQVIQRDEAASLERKDCVKSMAAVTAKNRAAMEQILRTLEEAIEVLDGHKAVSEELRVDVQDLQKTFLILHELHVETGELLGTLCRELGIILEAAAAAPPSPIDPSSPSMAIPTTSQAANNGVPETEFHQLLQQVEAALLHVTAAGNSEHSEESAESINQEQS